MTNLYSFVFPILIWSIVFAIVEDIMVPEESGNRKLIDKSLQSIIMIAFLLTIDFIAQKIQLEKANHYCSNVKTMISKVILA